MAQCYNMNNEKYKDCKIIRCPFCDTPYKILIEDDIRSIICVECRQIIFFNEGKLHEPIK